MAIEREVLRIRPVIPLSPSEFRRPLGPGYQAGWFARNDIGSRIDNCDMPTYDENFNTRLDQRHAQLQEMIRRSDPFESFGRRLEGGYHVDGHIFISQACSPIYENGFGEGVMAYSTMSARDPIFYRWHTHIEDLIQQFKDSRRPL